MMRNKTGRFMREIRAGLRCARCKILFAEDYPRAGETHWCDECAEHRPLIQVPLDVSRIIAPLSTWISDADIFAGDRAHPQRRTYYRNRAKILEQNRLRYARMKKTRGGNEQIKRERAQTLD